MNPKILRRLELLDTKQRKLRIKGKHDLSADINITPLVDVVLVLLIIFMVVTPLLNSGIELPKTLNPKPVAETRDDLKISIKKTGQVAISDVPVEEKKLADMLAQELKKNPFRSVYLSADKDLQFKSIREILSALRDAGVSQAGLMSKPIEQED